MIRISLARPAAAAALWLLFGLTPTLPAETGSAMPGDRPGARLVASGGTPEARAACESDAMALCGQFVPDERRITVCMTSQSNRNLLSPACHRYIYGRNR